MKLSLAMTSIALVLCTALAAEPKSGWDTLVTIQLSNDYNDFSVDRCSEEAMTNLRSEMYTWVNDELLSIFGQNTADAMKELIYTNEEDVLANHVALESEFYCRLCGQKQWSSARSIHNVAYLLQWFTQLAMDDWIEDNESILEGCMHDKIHVKLSIEKLGVEQNTFVASKAVFSDNALNTISLLQK